MYMYVHTGKLKVGWKFGKGKVENISMLKGLY